MLLPRLHVVTDDAVLAREGWLTAATSVVEAGGPRVVLHVRGPRTGGRALFERSRHLLDTARASGSRVFVNDRVDVALTAGADGVHLGRRSLDVAGVRELLASGRTVGVSTHGVEELRAARDDGADYAFVGTIFPTPSHEGLPGIGVSGLREALLGCEGLPVLGIGGLTPERVGDVMGAGAHGVALVRGVWDAPDAARAVLEYLTAIEDAIDER